ncbi:MAG TPA: XrtA system polysaccharide deacetylase [Thermoanaerobaculia bacterium]|nr:XrtA system polysaccharide deacetylase [Thermoanaerobaculia bacterium]
MIPSQSRVVNALTIDFEDWYQGLEIAPEDWGHFESRIVPAGERVLQVLRNAGVKATFFVLGMVAERHPEIVRAIAAEGHELGTHGLSHTFIYKMTPQTFREEMKRAIGAVEQITGRKVLGHRAPYFSITKQSLWALDILSELGVTYDSSIFPVANYRYGIEDAPRWPYDIPVDGKSLREFPISTWRVLGKNVPVAGGAYFRIFPYAVTRAAFRSINRSGQAAVFYIHPWELDPDHPRIELPKRIAATHYFNLRATEPRMVRLLRDFRFAPMKEVLGVHSNND